MSVQVWEIKAEETGPFSVELQTLAAGIVEGRSTVRHDGAKTTRPLVDASDPACTPATDTLRATLFSDAGFQVGSHEISGVQCGSTSLAYKISVIGTRIEIWPPFLLSTCDLRGEPHYAESDCPRVLRDRAAASGETAPDMGFTKDNNARTLSVVKAPVGSRAIKYVDGLDWGGDCAVTDLNGSGKAPTNADTVAAGDVLVTDCAEQDEMHLIHVPTNTVVFRADFT